MEPRPDPDQRGVYARDTIWNLFRVGKMNEDQATAHLLAVDLAARRGREARLHMRVLGDEQEVFTPVPPAADPSVRHTSRESMRANFPTVKASGRRKRVLVVDDDDATREAVRTILELSDYLVDTAVDGAEALEKVRTNRPDAVLLDLMMPVMDGWKFMEACRSDPTCVQLPVVVLSAARNASESAAALGSHGCVLKPFDIRDLLDAVEQQTQN